MVREMEDPRLTRLSRLEVIRRATKSAAMGLDPSKSEEVEFSVAVTEEAFIALENLQNIANELRQLRVAVQGIVDQLAMGNR